MDVNSLLSSSMYKKGHVFRAANLPKWKCSSWLSGSLKMSPEDINSLRDTLIDLNFPRKTVNDAIAETLGYYD